MRTRHLPFAFLALSSLALAGCIFDTGRLGSFTLGYAIAEQTIEGSPLGGLLGGFGDVPIPLDIDLAAETAARDTGPAQHVYLQSLTLSITPTSEPAGDTDDFDFLDTIDIYAESTMSGSSLQRVRVATLDPVPEGARTITLQPEGVDLIEYVREGALLTASATGTQPSDDVSIDGSIVVRVDVL
jgi:hypothetical protein